MSDPSLTNLVVDHAPRTPESHFSGSDLDGAEALLFMSQSNDTSYTKSAISHIDDVTWNDMCVPPRKRMRLRAPCPESFEKQLVS